MAHHAYLVVGDIGQGIESALQYVEDELGLATKGNPNIGIERYGLFSVEDARRIITKANLAPVSGDQKAIIVAAQRLFHEAQNALLKVYEEPPPGTTLILCVPALGTILPTLQSRLQPLPQRGDTGTPPQTEDVVLFVSGTAKEREKLVEKIVADAKSDNDEKKQAARERALALLTGLTRHLYAKWQEKPDPETSRTLRDLTRMMPMLHERAAPLKPILEHVSITMPTTGRSFDRM